MVRTETKLENLDSEWIALILEAKEIGLTKEKVRSFLNQKERKEYFVENEKNTY